MREAHPTKNLALRDMLSFVRRSSLAHTFLLLDLGKVLRSFSNILILNQPILTITA